MKIFDAQVRTDSRSDDELRNLQYFDTTELVTTAHAVRQFAHADDLLDYFEWLTGKEIERLRKCGLIPHAALGVLPDARPRRSHPKVWARFPELLEDPAVVAVGEIAAWEDADADWELFERQVKLALAADLPVIVTPPHTLRVNMTYKMMHRLEKLGQPPDRCLMNLLDEPLLRTVLEEGFAGGIAVGYRQIEPREGATILRSVLEDLPECADRAILNSSLRSGAADILGIPKTVVALGEAGVDTQTIEKLAHDNAQRFFRTAR